MHDVLKQNFLMYLQSEYGIGEFDIGPVLSSPPNVAESSYSYNDQEIESVAQRSPSLDELLDQAKKEKPLGAYLREKAFRCQMSTYQPALFQQAQISRDYWSRLLNHEVNPSKEKLLRVAVLLKLSLEEAEELLDKAGYALSQSILRDVIVAYCLRTKTYDFAAIEALLEDHEVQSLFNDRRMASNL